MHRLVRSSLVGILLVACRSPEITGLVPDVPLLPETAPAVRVVPHFAWAGGTITLRVTGVEEPPPTLELRLGTATVELVAQDDSTYTGRLLPTASSGWQDGHVTLEGVWIALQGVRVFNTRGTRVYPLSTTMRASTKFTIGQNAKLMVPTPDRLVFLDLDVESMVGDDRLKSTAPGGPAPTADRHVWAIQPEVDGPLERWRIWPTLERLDTLPRFGQGHFEAFSLFAFEYVLGVTDDRHGWVRELRHDATFRERLSLNLLGPQRVVIAPGGGRAILVGHQLGFQQPGRTEIEAVPVFEPASGEVAFTLAGLPHITAADFSADGQSLAIAGDSSAGAGHTLRAMDAYGGYVRLDTSYVAPIRGLGFDEFRPLLYVVTGSDPDAMEVVVYRRSGGWYEQVGLMSATCASACTDQVMVVSSVLESLYVVEIDSAGGRLSATKFWTPYRFEQI